MVLQRAWVSKVHCTPTGIDLGLNCTYDTDKERKQQRDYHAEGPFLDEEVEKREEIEPKRMSEPVRLILAPPLGGRL